MKCRSQSSGFSLIVTESFAHKAQEKLLEYDIEFRTNKPGSSHLNGKVERSQQIDKTAFYATVDLSDASLEDLLAEWQATTTGTAHTVHIMVNHRWEGTLNWQTKRLFSWRHIGLFEVVST
jgi:transposase InsO family protein